jgi:hypothetical protein
MTIRIAALFEAIRELDRSSTQGSGNGFFARAASTCDVTQTGVVTYLAE